MITAIIYPHRDSLEEDYTPRTPLLGGQQGTHRKLSMMIMIIIIIIISKRYLINDNQNNDSNKTSETGLEDPPPALRSWEGSRILILTRILALMPYPNTNTKANIKTNI